MAKGKLVLLGSGETAPGMTKVHRELLSGLDEVRAVNLDTPYGFQLNVPQMTQKLVDYFKVSLQTDLRPLSFTNYEKSSGVERELFRQSVREANYVFAGPGSPSYALAQWKGLDLQEDLLHVLDNGGVVCFSSAAALTLGAFTAPIYEIYKAGAEPHWLEGLNLMGLLGINCAVIPHFNNAEGQDYDTSCCYLGVERLENLERELPDNCMVLGIDEHSALLFDLESERLSVTGNGNVCWRIDDDVKYIKNRENISFNILSSHSSRSKKTLDEVGISNSLSPLKLAEHIEIDNISAYKALAELVKMTELSLKKTNELTSLVEGILSIRNKQKSMGNYQYADELRGLLIKANIKIQDSSNGVEWSFET